MIIIFNFLKLEECRSYKEYRSSDNSLSNWNSFEVGAKRLMSALQHSWTPELQRSWDLEREIERMVREHRGTIYTVCYMFSNDQDEVADLFQEVLINLWKSLPSFEGRSDVRFWI